MTIELKHQKRQFLIILIIIFLGFIGISIPYLIFPPLFLNPDYAFLSTNWGESGRAIFLGITLAVYPIGQFVGAPVLGSLSDEYGRKHLLSASLVIAAIANFLTGVAIAKEHLGLLMISRFIGGIMEGNVAIGRAMCADLKLLPKQQTFGKLNAATSIAYLIGPLVGGVMADKDLFQDLTASSPFFIISILFFFLAVLSACILTSSVIPVTSKKPGVWERFNFVHRIGKLFSNKNLKTLMITSTCFTLGVDIFYEFGPVYLTLKWTLGPAQLIFYNGILCLGLAIGNGWLPVFISSRSSSLLWIKSAMSGFALLMMGIIFTNVNFLMFLWFALSGLFIGLIVTLLTVKISDSAPDNVQGEVMGTQLSLRVLGDGIICLLGGSLLILSPKIILILAACLSLLAMVYYTERKDGA